MQLSELARHAATVVDGDRDSKPRTLVEVLPGLHLLRERAPTSFESMVYQPTLCLILQGKKRTTLGARTFSTEAGQCLVVSHDLAVTARIVEAPYLSLLLRLDIGLLRSLGDEVAAAGLDTSQAKAMTVHAAQSELIDAFGRMLSLFGPRIGRAATTASRQARVLAPLIVKEIHYRLLMAPFGGMLRRMAMHDPQASAVARAIAHIRREFRGDISVPELARLVGMSGSSFHRHFKAVTSSTPLQYQKELRLLEARRQIVEHGVAVTSAALDVGYESASQFTHEYRRKFGRAPSRETRATSDALAA